MPQVVAAVLIGAGIAAGVKWIAREMARAADEARGAHERPAERAAVAAAPKDLGTLEWDAKSRRLSASRKRTSLNLGIEPDQRLGACSFSSVRSMPTTRDAGPLAFEQHWTLMRAPSNSRNTSSARSSGSA